MKNEKQSLVFLLLLLLCEVGMIVDCWSFIVGKGLDDPTSVRSLLASQWESDTSVLWKVPHVDDFFWDAHAPETIFWSPQQSVGLPQRTGLCDVGSVFLCFSSPCLEGLRMEGGQKLQTEKAHPKIGRGLRFSLCGCVCVCACMLNQTSRVGQQALIHLTSLPFPALWPKQVCVKCFLVPFRCSPHPFRKSGDIIQTVSFHKILWVNLWS